MFCHRKYRTVSKLENESSCGTQKVVVFIALSDTRGSTTLEATLMKT